MKKTILLGLSFFATQTLTAHHPPGAFRNPAPEISWAESSKEISDKTELVAGSSNQTTGQHTNNSAASQQILVQNRVDRVDFDTEKGVSLPGSTVAELLNQNTCYTIDLTSYDQLPVSANIQVIIDQEPMAIRATQVTAALRQIPAEKIKTIQISTSPAANPETTGAVDIIISVTRIN